MVPDKPFVGLKGLQMSDMTGIADLVAQVKEASASIAQGDDRFTKRLDGLENSINELYRKTSRPGGFGGGETDERKDAIGHCIAKHDLLQPKDDGRVGQYSPSEAQISEAMTARKALRALWRVGNPTQLSTEHQKSLSSFSFGTNAFILPPTMSNRVISCIIDRDDVAGLVDNVNVSGPSIKFLIDNVRMQVAGWACQSSCFANAPQDDLKEGLGELEIKVESLRHIVCVGRDLLADASFPLENWILRKASIGFRDAISAAILTGDGLGKPMGLLNQRSGIPICDVSPTTPPAQFSWADLVMLKYEVPLQWQQGSVFLMNSRTFALLMTMQDAMSRPIWAALPEGAPGFQIAGSPVKIVNWMPDVEAGSTPILFVNLKQTYLLVTRQALEMVPDVFTAHWCVLFRFEV